ncbi:PaaI family thioesterase [Blastococcus goldschmidtiae]|uniref:PaaI family thioesterase n=1 Tax=Blastococcus goldschmidtiae TaxID=3075546 RepID=A0ABU2K2J5_9ACTN|nr:PaaI family thioesterase [Blastococcus sp. DSM 46792]MDT0274432.1 PaaI family thioesterase [Blastococcus sp. DSM 46792]
MNEFPVPAAAQDHTGQAGWGRTRARTVSWHDPAPTAAVGLTMPGADYLRAMHAGRLPSSPIARLTGLTPDVVADGDVAFRCVADESFTNPVGVIHGGLLCTLLDAATASAVHSTLPAGVAFTTVEIKVSYLRTVRAGDELHVRGWVTKSGRRVCFAEASARTAAGDLVATGSSSILLTPLGDAVGRAGS